MTTTKEPIAVQPSCTAVRRKFVRRFTLLLLQGQVTDNNELKSVCFRALRAAERAEAVAQALADGSPGFFEGGSST
jgi:hypothetical protein